MRDFTLSMYEKLCQKLTLLGYHNVTLKEFITDPKNKKLIIRHDVDYNIDDALVFAEIEHRFGISSTYFIRLNKKNNNVNKIGKLKDFSHEIGYHYDVLDKAHGDMQKAISMFKAELNLLRKICKIETVSPHGSGLTKWLNDDILKHINLKKFGIIGDAMNSLDFKRILYISDTGMNWDITKQCNIKDHPPNYQIKENRLMVKSTNGVLKLFEKINNGNKLYLSIHPENWAKNEMIFWQKYFHRKVKNVGKIIIQK